MIVFQIITIGKYDAVVSAVDGRNFPLPKIKTSRVNEFSQRITDARRFKEACRHLVKQRREIVEVVLVYQRHVEFTVRQMFDKVNSRESTADDGDTRFMLILVCHIEIVGRQIPRALCGGNPSVVSTINTRQ